MKIFFYSLPTFPLNQESPNTSNMKWNLFYCRNIYFVMKDIYGSLAKKTLFLTIFFPPFSFSRVISHKSHMLLYLNGLNPWIDHLDIFFEIYGTLFFWRKPGNKRSSYFDYFKSGAFIPRQSAQHFKIHSHFGRLLSPLADVVVEHTRLCQKRIPLDIIMASAIVWPPDRANSLPFSNCSISWARGSVGL